MSIPNPANDTDLQLRLAALEIDLCSALALSNALLRGMKATSPQAHHAIDLALDDALRAIATEDRRDAAAVHAIVSRVREGLRSETGLEERMARDLERLIIEKASTVPGDGGAAVEDEFVRRKAR